MGLTIEEIKAAKDIRAFLESEARQSVLENRHIEPLKTFSVPGGVALHYHNHLRNPDTVRFLQIFAYLRNSGIPIDPEFELDVPNLIYGRNFLKERDRADVTIVANVNIPQGHADHPVARKAWGERLSLTQSKLIFSVFYGIEVDLHDVPLPDYLPLGAKAPLDPDPTVCRDMNQVVSSRNFHMDKWQMVGERGFIETAAPLLGGHTQMNIAIFKQAAHLGAEQKKRRQSVLRQPETAASHIL